MMKKINTSINDLKSVLDTIQSGVISINKDKFLIFYNDKAKRIFSLSENSKRIFFATSRHTSLGKWI